MWVYFGVMHQGIARTQTGDADGLPEVESAFADWIARGHLIVGTHINGMLAELHAKLGNWGEGIRRLDLAFAIADSSGEHGQPRTDRCRDRVSDHGGDDEADDDETGCARIHASSRMTAVEIWTK